MPLHSRRTTVEDRPVEFIEQIFGICPDDADGTCELLFLAAFPLIPLVALYLRHRRPRR